MLLVTPEQPAVSEQARPARNWGVRSLPGLGSFRTFIWPLRRSRRGMPSPPLVSIRDGG